MAFFNKKTDLSKKVKTNKSENATAKTETALVTRPAVTRNLSAVIIKPRITEKAVGMNEKNIYTFIVRQNATKYDVRDAVREFFNVTPVRINIVNSTPRQYTSRRLGRVVTEKGMKKAYVQLKKGDSISIV